MTGLPTIPEESLYFKSVEIVNGNGDFEVELNSYSMIKWTGIYEDPGLGCNI